MLFGIAVGSNFFKRKRTICVDLSDLNILPYKPPYTDAFANFLKNDMAVDMAQVESVSVHPLAPYCMFKVKTDVYYEHLYDRTKDGIRWSGKGRVSIVKCDDVFTEVKVLGVSPETPEVDIGVFLSAYGEIIGDIRRGKIKGTNIHDGSYFLKMILTEGLPCFVPQAEEGEMWVIRHEGQDQTCFKCLGTGHMSRTCTEQPHQFGKDCRLAAKAWRAQLLYAAEQERIARQGNANAVNPQAEVERAEEARQAQARADKQAAEAQQAQAREDEAQAKEARQAQAQIEADRQAEEDRQAKAKAVADQQAKDARQEKTRAEKIQQERALAEEAKITAEAEERAKEAQNDEDRAKKSNVTDDDDNSEEINDEDQDKQVSQNLISNQIGSPDKLSKKKSKKEKQKLKKLEEKKRNGSELSEDYEDENTNKSPRVEIENDPLELTEQGSPKKLSPNERRRFSLSGGLVKMSEEDLKVDSTPLIPKLPSLYHKNHTPVQPPILLLDEKLSNNKKVTKENRTGV